MAGSGLLLQVIPLAVGAAISPAVLTVEILVLASGPGAVARGWGLALGRMAGLLAVSLGGASLLARLPDFGTGEPSLPLGVTALIAGVVLIVVGLVEWRRPSSGGHHDRLAGRLQHLNPAVLLAFGAGWLFVNVSTLALYLPALHIITNSAADLALQVIAFVILYLFASAVVLVPVVAVTLFGDRARALLAKVHTWVGAHAHTITLVVCLAFGVVLVGWGTVTVIALA